MFIYKVMQKKKKTVIREKEMCGRKKKRDRYRMYVPKILRYIGVF